MLALQLQKKSALQGYLAHQKLLPPKILPYAYALGPAEVPGGLKFLMSEVPLNVTSLPGFPGGTCPVQGYLAYKKQPPPPRAAIVP